MNYWDECVRIAFEETGISATEEQIKYVVEAIEGGHENYSMAHGHDCIPNPIALENNRLERELKKERSKIVCPECKGEGRIISNYLNRSSNTGCWKCGGEGKIIL